DVGGALEEHVLEEVGEARAPRALVRRADVVPEVDGDDGRGVVLGEDDIEPVGERVPVDGYRGHHLRRIESSGGTSGAMMRSAAPPRKNVSGTFTDSLTT